MKKGSSGKKKKTAQTGGTCEPLSHKGQCLQSAKRTAETTGAGGETGTRMAAGADGLCADTASCKEEEAQAEKKGQPHDDAFACICNHCVVSGGADWQPCDKGL